LWWWWQGGGRFELRTLEGLLAEAPPSLAWDSSLSGMADDRCIMKLLQFLYYK